MSISKFAIVATIAIVLSACGTRSTTTPQLTVSGHPVSIALYTSLVAAERQKIERSGVSISPTSASGRHRQKSIEASVIRELVRDAVVEQLAAAHGITISTVSVEARVTSAEQAFGGRPAFEQALEQAGLSRGDFTSVLRYRLLEAQLRQIGVGANAIDEAVARARVVITIGPCASGNYPACLSGGS